MARAINNVASKRRRKKVLKQAKGAYAARSRLFQNANETVKRALQYAYRDRRNKKRVFRRLWIARINAATRVEGLSYSRFINGLKLAGIEVDRRTLSELAIYDSVTFAAFIKQAKEALAK
jgi:large subunit ribosomal protein L20